MGVLRPDVIEKDVERAVEDALDAMEPDEVQELKKRKGEVEEGVEVWVMLRSLRIRLEVEQRSPKALETLGSYTQS